MGSESKMQLRICREVHLSRKSRLESSVLSRSFQSLAALDMRSLPDRMLVFTKLRAPYIYQAAYLGANEGQSVSRHIFNNL